jgi:hypothetical protein
VTALLAFAQPLGLALAGAAVLLAFWRWAGLDEVA